MYIAIKGTLINGQIILEEPPPTQALSVVIILIEEEPKFAQPRQPGSLLKVGRLQGKTYKLPNDFNDPLEDLQEYLNSNLI